jgi:hypothetical protein
LEHSPHQALAHLLDLTCAKDTIISLNSKTGALVWNHHLPPALGMEVAGHAGP